MCLQTSPWAAQEAEVSLPRKCNTALVEEILANAAQASLEAPNRALKRRVRQRLHKKLGSMLTCEEFGSAMERFKDMEAKNEAGATSPTTHTVPVLTSTPPPQPVQQAFLVPILMPMMQMVPTCPSMTTFQEPKMAPVEKDVHTDAASQSTMDDEDSISELSTEWQRATSLGPAYLPVERTFIQFDTRMHVRHRRSRSV
mmetsp:Transcript_11081/g.13402  ORF Transcript_11081/g.13402 Transcript_11081/m.13402 type:complete len:199 (-) Transcript_11081:54-650(-)